MKASINLFIPLIPLIVVTVTAANHFRQETIKGRCEAERRGYELEQLHACNASLRHYKGCFLPTEDQVLNRSCLNKVAAIRIHQACIDDQGFWGKSIKKQASYGQLVHLSQAGLVSGVLEGD
jgi:hypothetical protein